MPQFLTGQQKVLGKTTPLAFVVYAMRAGHGTVGDVCFEFGKMLFFAQQVLTLINCKARKNVPFGLPFAKTLACNVSIPLETTISEKQFGESGQQGMEIAGNPLFAAAKSFISVWDTVGILRRGWIYLLVGCGLGLFVSLTYVLVAPSPYKSTARVLIDKSANRYFQANKILEEPVIDDSDVGSQIYMVPRCFKWVA